MTKFDALLAQADALIGEAMRMSRSSLAQENLKEAQFCLDDASAREAQQRKINFGSRTPINRK